MYLKGIATSSGIAIGKVYKLEQPNIVIGAGSGDPEKEMKILEDALTKTISDIEQIKVRASATLAPEELAIFDAHLMMAQDPEFKDQIIGMIKDGSSADQATKTVSDMMIGMFESMDDAIEGSKYCSFDTKVTFKGIDLDTADDEELERFADSIADSLMWLNDETGYNDIRINSFYYRPADEYGAGFKTKDELVDSIIKKIKLDRKIKKKNKK